MRNHTFDGAVNGGRVASNAEQNLIPINGLDGFLGAVDQGMCIFLEIT
jgi:hypothetical protein